ncbi:MAG: helix-turn-helix domain-containing protein, partial [Delftia sp.]|nr:helix-turn-helix domain-containing protein [Delftia sp.]
MIYADSRLVAELSLDIVTPGSPDTSPPDENAPHPYYELEAELQGQGNEADLHALAAEFKTTWGLQPEARSKFERGLGLVGGTWGHPMEGPLTHYERATLQTWLEVGSAPRQRRARIMLLNDQGLSNQDIAAEVGLSVRQVRRWLAAFRTQRMQIFPRLEIEAPPSAGEPEPHRPDVQKGEPAPPSPLSVDELCARHQVDADQAAHVQRLALQLFDLSAHVHGLAPERQGLLGAAASLHKLGLAQSPRRHHLAGSELILAQPIEGLDSTEQDVLASLVAFHRKKVRRPRCAAFARLPPATQKETLALAALLRMAVALDTSQTQEAAIRPLTAPQQDDA